MQAFLSSTDTAIVFCLEPVTAGLVAVFLVAERLNGVQLAGAAFIVAAMISSQVPPPARRYADSEI
jgi:drug/metabolite transporter (DMT)-like permease